MPLLFMAVWGRMETYLTIEGLADYLKIAKNVTIPNNIHSRILRTKLTRDDNIRRNILWAGETR